MYVYFSNKSRKTTSATRKRLYNINTPGKSDRAEKRVQVQDDTVGVPPQVSAAA